MAVRACHRAPCRAGCDPRHAGCTRAEAHRARPGAGFDRVPPTLLPRVELVRPGASFFQRYARTPTLQGPFSTTIQHAQPDPLLMEVVADEVGLLSRRTDSCFEVGGVDTSRASPGRKIDPSTPSGPGLDDAQSHIETVLPSDPCIAATNLGISNWIIAKRSASAASTLLEPGGGRG